MNSNSRARSSNSVVNRKPGGGVAGRNSRAQAGSVHNFDQGNAPGQARVNSGGPGGGNHPRGHEPVPYDRPMHFWHHGPHYFGYPVHHLPHYDLCWYWGRPYYYYNNLWYRWWNDCYYVCRPPFGYAFDPVVDMALDICRFAYYCDVYRTYDVIDDNAATIQAQNETIAANNALIAQQNAEIAAGSAKAAEAQASAGKLGLVQSYADASVEYYYQDGVFYTKNSEGKYVVIVPPAGAMVESLPDDYDVVTLEGVEYYKVDDTLYKMTVLDGKAYFEVVGQMSSQSEGYAVNE